MGRWTSNILEANPPFHKHPRPRRSGALILQAPWTNTPVVTPTGYGADRTHADGPSG